MAIHLVDKMILRKWSILLSLILFLSWVHCSNARELQTSKWEVDPVSLTAEPTYFAGYLFKLPPGQLFLGKEFNHDSDVKNMLCVEFDTLGVRFGSQNFIGCVNLVVAEKSKLAATIKEIRDKRLWAQPTIRLEKRTRLQGGMTEFTYYLGVVEKIDTVKLGAFQPWNELHLLWQQNIGKRYRTYLWFQGLVPKEFRKCGKYMLIDAWSEKGFSAGNYKNPGRNITPAIPSGKKSVKGFLKKVGKIEGFCSTEIKIAETTVEDKYAGKVKAGLAVVDNMTPLKVATDFGAPKPADTTLKNLDGTKLTDTEAFFKNPRFFIGHEHRLYGSFNLDDSFTSDKDLKGFKKVNFSSYGGSAGFEAKAGRVAIVVPENSAVERALKKLPYQTRGILEVKLEERKRKLGGVVDVGYYLGVVTGVKLWNDETWSKLRSEMRSLKGEKRWVIAKIADIADKRYQTLSGYILLDAKSTSQHSAGDARYLSRELNLAVKDDEESRKKLAKLLMMTNGFCRFEVNIEEVGLTDKYGKEQKALIGLIKAVEPMKTASDFTTLPSSFEKEDVLLTWAPLNKITPTEQELKRWFKDSQSKVRRSQYDDFKKEKEPDWSEGDKYRFRRDGENGKSSQKWTYSKEIPAFGSDDRPKVIWEKGKRSFSKSNSYSYMSGGGGGYITITTVDFGSSKVTVPTWFRMFFNPKTGKWEKVDSKPTLNRISDIQKEVLKISPERNKLVKLIMNVEENNTLSNKKESLARATEMYDRWEKDPSRDNPASKKRIAEARKKLAKDKEDLDKLEADYQKAIKDVSAVNETYQKLMDEVEAFAEGKKEVLLYNKNK